MGGLWVLVGSRGAFQLDMRLGPLKLSRSCACKSIRQQISIECPCAHGLAEHALFRVTFHHRPGWGGRVSLGDACPSEAWALALGPLSQVWVWVSPRVCPLSFLSSAPPQPPVSPKG